MKFNLQGFIDVFTWQVTWLDANFFWVLLSVVIYIVLIILSIQTLGAFLEEFKQRLYEKKLRWLYYLLVLVFWFYAITLLLEYIYE